ncbi:MAG: hypothetical protein IJ122_05950 [Methanobrevibacter sp.]|nr:hypothetical protein [Methanobrevibacter sp.]
MITESQVKKYMNAKSNGGGNPYHDELGRFTSGPSTAFGRFASTKAYTPKAAKQRLGIEGDTNLSNENLTAAAQCYDAAENIFQRCGKSASKSSFDEIKKLANDISVMGAQAQYAITNIARSKSSQDAKKSMATLLSIAERSGFYGQRILLQEWKTGGDEASTNAKYAIAPLKSIYQTMKYINNERG